MEYSNISSSSCLSNTSKTTNLLLILLASIISCLIFTYNLFITKFMKLNNWCKCDICTAFITRSWQEKFTNLPDWYAHLLQNSPTKTIHIHILNNTITANPTNLEYMLRTNFDNYPKGKPTSDILGDLLGKGIFIVDGDHWRFQRKLASLELGSNSIRAYGHEVISHELRDRLIPLLEKPMLRSCNNFCVTNDSLTITVDLQAVFRKFSFDNICKFSFGVDPMGLTGLAEAFDVASNLSAERAMHPSSIGWRAKRLLNVGSERRLRAAIKEIDVLAGSIIKGRREKRFENKDDLLSRFMGSVNDEKYLRDIVVSFLLAGRDTVSSGLTFFFYLLAQHPEAEARIIEEGKRAMGLSQVGLKARSSSIATLEELKDMHYLHAAIYESIRLFPPVQMDSKFAKENDVLADGTHIVKGTRVAYHPYAMGRMEDIWGPDCLQFRPERWLSQEGMFIPESPYKYPVFQAGVRVCLGKDMALLSMKTVALALVMKFEIRLADPNWTPRFIPGLTATLKDGMHVVVKERSIMHRLMNE